MLTPAVLSAVTSRTEPDPPVVCIIWRRVHHGWDFFCRAPLADAERIVICDQRAMGLMNEDYQVRRG